MNGSAVGVGDSEPLCSSAVTENIGTYGRALRFGSLFSGIGGIDLGLERAGMECAWQCEIDPAAKRVLNRHWPDVPVFPDVEMMHGAPAVDVLTGGFPCQDLSVAGRRAGLAGGRSGLWWEFYRLLSETTPRWCVIENVPGLLSATCPDADGNAVPGGSCPGGCMAVHGGAMGILLGALGDLGYGWAYRVLDAQYFGVAQRRRRVFIVGCLGDRARAVKVLFEPEGSEGNPPARRQAGQSVAGTLGGGAPGGGPKADTDRMTFVPEFVGALAAQGGDCPRNQEVDAAHYIAAIDTYNQDDTGAVFHTLRDGQRADHVPHVVHAPDDETDRRVTAFMWQAGGNNSASGAFEEDMTPTLPVSQTVAVVYPSDDPPMTIGLGSDPLHTEDLAQPVTGRNGDPGVVAYSTKLHNTNSNQAGKFYEEYTPSLQHDSPPPAVVTPMRAAGAEGANGAGIGREGDPALTLDTTGDMAVAYPLAMRGREEGAELEVGEQGVYNALRAGDGGSSRANHLLAGMTVRRLTPVECERLQGFPDGWTAKENDSARYRLLGNAVCVPVAEWIGRRIMGAV